MPYSDDAVKAKLNTLNETQDSIVANAQWIMFHRRFADRTAGLWLAKLQDSMPPKRLNLIYLANEVVQQSRARGKQDFTVAFEPMIAEATSLAYKGASTDVQGKLRRVVEVWRQRTIFDGRILDTVDERLDELDKQRGFKQGGGGKLGGSLFGGSIGSSVPAELEAVSKAQTSLTKAEAATDDAVEAAHAEYAKMNDANTPVPTPPVHASRLSGLLKKLASAQGVVEARIETRKALLKGLEQLIEDHNHKLRLDEEALANIVNRKDETESKKKEVEDAIMQGLSNPTSPDTGPSTNGSGDDPPKPEVEGFTPPPPDVEAFTPPPGDPNSQDISLLLGGDSIGGQAFSSTTGAEPFQEHPTNMNSPPPPFELPSYQADQASAAAAAAANEFLNNLTLPAVRQAPTGTPPDGNISDPRLKRRKLNHNVDDDIFGAEGGLGVDEEGISAMLNQ